MIFDRDQYINQPLPIEAELSILFKKKDSLTIFDIGACEGEDSIKYARLFPSAVIKTFEPIPKNQKKIEANLIKYNINNVTLFPFALSNTAGEATFHLSAANEAIPNPDSNWDFGNKSSSLLQPHEHLNMVKFISFDEQIIVQTTTIDIFCKQQGVSLIDFIHMDVQGAELMVLTGANKMSPSIKAIWLEVSKVSLYKDQPLAKDIEKFMKRNDFVLMKDAVDNVTGDRLYISKKYFPDYKEFLHKKDYKVQLVAFAKKVVHQLKGK